MEKMVEMIIKEHGVPERVAKRIYREYREEVKMFGEACDPFEEFVEEKVHDWQYPDC